MNEKIIMTEHGVAVALSSPCCRAPMNITPRKTTVNQEERKITTEMDFICSKCGSLYDIEMAYHRKLVNVKITFSFDPDGMK